MTGNTDNLEIDSVVELEFQRDQGKIYPTISSVSVEVPNTRLGFASTFPRNGNRASFKVDS